MTFERARRVLCSLVLVPLMTVAVPTFSASAQQAVVVPAPPLASFAAMRVAIFPVQLWRADTSGWSREVTWATMRLAVDSAIAEELQARGLGRRWAYAQDLARSAKRNPTYATDPYAIGVGRWRSVMPRPDDQIPQVVADNMRPLTALGDTRYALIPVELRADGDRAVLRLVLADTRGRTVVWAGDLISNGGLAMVDSIAKHVANLVLEP